MSRSHSKRASIVAGNFVEIDSRKILVTTIFTHNLGSSDEIFVSGIPMIQRRTDEELAMPIYAREHEGYEIFSASKITERPLFSLAIRRGSGRRLQVAEVLANEERDLGVRREDEFLVIATELEII